MENTSSRNKIHNITIFMPSLGGGGAERVMINIARGFIENGINVDLVLAMEDGPFLKELHRDINIVNLRVNRVIYALPKLIIYLRKVKPKVVFSTLNRANLILILAKVLSKVTTKVIIREANTPSQSIKSNKTLKNYIMFILMSILYPKADLVIAVSEGVANDLKNVFKNISNQVIVINNPVVTPELLLKANESAKHPWIHNKNNHKIILGVGRLSKQKGFKILVDAFYIVEKIIPSKLIILGEGEERFELEGMTKELFISNKVSLPGFVNNPFTFMKNSDVFVLSSLWEGLPNVLIQALAVGTPVVATDCQSGPSEIIINKQIGRLVPPGNPNALARAIIDILGSPTNKKILVQRANAYSLSEIIPKYINVINAIIEN